MIRLQNVTKAYRHAGRELVALDDATLTITRGEFAVVLGRSGAGKSTLLALMGGLLGPGQGEVYFEDQSLWGLTAKQRARMRADKIGFVLQQAPVIQSLTALENVLLPSMFARRGNRDAHCRAEALLASVGLADRAHAFPHELSGGEVRRVAIASALMNKPDVLLADEPTGDLDYQTEQQILALLLQLNRQGMTVVMVTHNEDLAASADHLIRIDRGRVYEICRDTEVSGGLKAG